MGLVGFLIAGLGLVCFWIPGLGQMLAIVGGILSFVGIRQAAWIRKTGGYADNGLAIAGLVIAVLALVPATIVTLIATALAGGATAPPPDVTYF